MTQRATVKAVLADGTAIITVRRGTACASGCAGCGGCAHHEDTLEVPARNTAAARPGDRVVVESKTATVLGLAGLLYLLPVALLVLGYFAMPWGETARILGALAGLALGLALCRVASTLVARGRGVSLQIVALDERPWLH